MSLLCRIIPAYAGSTRESPATAKKNADHPRIRGEHASTSAGLRKFSGSSPHTRGAPAMRRGCRCRGRIIPAYAGSTTGRPGGSPQFRDHPRIRGEHVCDGAPKGGPGGSSPHTRGALVVPGLAPFGGGIIPAYAGSTSGWIVGRRGVWDHPRIRGEHPRSKSPGGFFHGSSPHTRGALRLHRRHQTRRGIIPAYAGSTWRQGRLLRRGRHHPRIRGEHIIGSIGMVIGWGSSPHTRGAPSSQLQEANQATDHPRIRGEHAACADPWMEVPGSSPHTRGAPLISAA